MDEYREWLKEKGYCINCGKEKAWNGRTMCPECLEKNKECSERTRSENSREQRRRYIKRKRELCIAFGICRECMHRPATVGKKCLECHVKEIKRNKEKSIDKTPRNIRRELDLCYICGETVAKGHKLCPRHLEVVRNNMSKWNRDNSNHIWRKIQTAEIDKIKFYYK